MAEVGRRPRDAENDRFRIAQCYAAATVDADPKTVVDLPTRHALDHNRLLQGVVDLTIFATWGLCGGG